MVMLTGDNRTTAEAIAREVGIDEIHAELLPENKVKKLEEIIARYGTVAMVGDGVNDAPAMARANLGDLALWHLWDMPADSKNVCSCQGRPEVADRLPKRRF